MPTPSETSIEQGLINRRRVLGDAWVDQSVANANAVNVEFQRLITSYAWDQIWSRPGLDRRTRRIMVLAITASMGRWDEFELHVRTGLQAPRGDEQAAPLDLETLKEVLLQTAVYAGVPAGNTGMAIVLKVARELGLELAPADFHQPMP
ncbi:carboxymuconolactone decarboxylase [Diaphorobacter sp. HDW4B]|uniref:carboxymuconolactone decarboxylase family protein n=1 Tax=Diaphorobacter sp. HDW4B TaxID=2714925 RepID=UPI00140E60AE|nr:carboxymuconolactone decarboxylase family protein [Diaphorobacter sp. HDW4B]QIL71781.1 carboxymuconolactone decarboxylase [Diaphorobacter sp. HDW4B]